MILKDLLRHLRINNRQKQKEILGNNLSLSVYSRIESGKQSIHMDDLEQVTDNLSVTGEELILLSNFDEKQRKFITLYRYCATHLDNKSKKQQLLNRYYNDFTFNTIELRFLNNFLAIKSFFSIHWDEVDSISDDEVTRVVSYIETRSFLTHYDYNILLNISSLLSKQQADIIIRKAIPIKHEDQRSHKTKTFAFNIIRNIITARLYENDFVTAKKYVDLAKKQDINITNYSYRMHIQYLDNLLKYLQTGKSDYHEKIVRYIHVLNDIGDYRNAEDINNELTMMVQQKGKSVTIDTRNFPPSLLKDN